ncbi:g4919 [Coccomyxa elongata]
MRQCNHVSGPAGRQGRLAGQLTQLPRTTHRGLVRQLPCKAGSAATLPRSGRSGKNSSSSSPSFAVFNDAQRLAANLGGSWGGPVSSSSLLDQREGTQRMKTGSSPVAVMPKAPPEWQPPTDPSGPTAPPEFTPPRDPGTAPRTVPEFEPPEQAPPGRDAPSPGRPARPEEIPDPERDPLRTPERRRETREPDEEEPQEEFEPEEQDVMAAVVAYVEQCQEDLSIEDERGGGIEIGIGRNSCPAALLYHPTGYTAVVNMHGANVVSWKRPDGSDILHLRPDSPMDGISPIMGGVPLIFPQFGRASGIAAYAGVGSSTIPTNGLLSRMHWSLAETGVSDPDILDPAPTAVFATESDESTYAIWPFHFVAIYTVSLMYTDEVVPDSFGLEPVVRGKRELTEQELAAAAAAEPETAPKRGRGRPAKWKPLDDKGNVEQDIEEDEVEEEEVDQQEVTPVQLRCVLEIVNTDDKPFAFEAAVQTHVGIGHIRLAEALGLAGKMVLDCDSNPDKPWLHVSNDESTTFGERRIDRVYIDAATEEKGFVMIHPGNDRYSLDLINRQGFRDLGLWNPHDDLPDPTMSQQFVAFSSGEIARPVRLQPQESWSGEMVLRLHEQEHLMPEGE